VAKRADIGGPALSDSYTAADHAFRARDPYARGKYVLTARWLRRHGPKQDAATGGLRLLHVGCGAGEFNSIATNLGFEVVACEPDPAAFELAERARPPGCKLHNCGLFELDVHDADVVVMHDVLEHIEDDRAAVRAVRDRLRVGGVAVISVPAHAWLFGEHDVQLGHFRRYSQRGLARVLGEQLVVERIRSYGASMIPVALWYSRLARKPYPTQAAGRGLLHSAMALVCDVESRIAMPFGTSVIALARRAA
jgi:2-polyprenyl-3-methyl-5-hydroxy-6-metoxy-1,4-benzoquinol methylase